VATLHRPKPPVRAAVDRSHQVATGVLLPAQPARWQHPYRARFARTGRGLLAAPQVRVVWMKDTRRNPDGRRLAHGSLARRPDPTEPALPTRSPGHQCQHAGRGRLFLGGAGRAPPIRRRFSRHGVSVGRAFGMHRSPWSGVQPFPEAIDCRGRQPRTARRSPPHQGVDAGRPTDGSRRSPPSPTCSSSSSSANCDNPVPTPRAEVGSLPAAASRRKSREGCHLPAHLHRRGAPTVLA
jgi:hypothetical protein